MFKNTLKRLGAIVLALAMAMSVMMVSAFATGDAYDAITSMSFTKKVTTDGNTYAPATQFTFSVEAATAADGETYQNVPVYSGVTGGVTITNPDVFTPGAGATVAKAYTKDGTFNFITTNTFTKPGIYKYTVTEDNGNYDGITYDRTARTLYVYVRNASAGGYEVYGAVLVKAGTDSQGNPTTTKNDPFINDYDTHDVTITKNITGLQADKNREFKFTVQVTGQDNEIYKMVVTKDGQETEQKLVSKAAAVEVSLGDGDSIHIYGLSNTDTYTVTETEANTDGYTTKIDGVETSTGVKSGSVTADNTSVVYENNREASTPTGVIMNIAPYVLMVALAGGIAFFFLRRRHAE